MMLKSKPVSTTAASRAIGTPAIVNGLPPANESDDSGAVLPKACRQPSVPRAVVLTVPTMKLLDARKPSVVKVTSVTELALLSAAAPPVSLNPSVRRLT